MSTHIPGDWGTLKGSGRHGKEQKRGQHGIAVNFLFITAVVGATSYDIYVVKSVKVKSVGGGGRRGEEGEDKERNKAEN